jgi:hypothetical protein
MSSRFRSLLLVMGFVSLTLAVGFLFEAGWAKTLWPWPASRLSCIFLSSILAAVGAPVLWIAYAREPRAIEAGAIDLAVMYAGMCASAFVFYAESDRIAVLAFALVTAAFSVASHATFAWSRKFTLRDTRPMPLPVRVSFGLFAVVLAGAATALILQAPHIFPWPLPKEASVLYGWIFAGAAVYFAHGVLRPSWANACGQLVGFLIYDLILIGPFAAHFATVLPDHRPSLIVYTCVLVYSGALAAYYLFVDRATRLWGGRSDRAPIASAPVEGGT